MLLSTPRTAQARATLETLRDANIRIWMLTGDKLETAMAIARNASLVPRRQPFYPVRVRCAAEVRQQLQGYPKGVLNAKPTLGFLHSLDRMVPPLRAAFEGAQRAGSSSA